MIKSRGQTLIRFGVTLSLRQKHPHFATNHKLDVTVVPERVAVCMIVLLCLSWM